MQNGIRKMCSSVFHFAFLILHSIANRHRAKALSILWLCLENSLCCCEACDRNAKRRATHVVQSNLIAEGYRARFAAMLAADADLEIGLDAATALRSHTNKLPHTFTIKHLKGIVRQYLVLDVIREETI